MHLDSGIKVDLFVLGDRPYDRREFERHRPELIQVDPERRVLVKAPEDIVLRKLQWYRRSGEVSERQWTDVLGVLRTQSDRLDTAHLRRWADELDLVDLLDRALDSA